jgi:Adenylate and Guanylate cyclase catalytic domain
VISAYQKCVTETVQRFGGFVAKYMGDGVLLYFGYPQAHEDDAERAVRAGLELIQAVGVLKSRAPLQTRVGIATGLVVVGDLVGSGAAQEQAIVGETPNVAARLQAGAMPGTIAIDIPRVSVDPDWESLRCNPNAYFFTKRIAAIEDNVYAAIRHESALVPRRLDPDLSVERRRIPIVLVFDDLPIDDPHEAATWDPKRLSGRWRAE